MPAGRPTLAFKPLCWPCSYIPALSLNPKVQLILSHALPIMQGMQSSRGSPAPACKPTALSGPHSSFGSAGLFAFVQALSSP